MSGIKDLRFVLIDPLKSEHLFEEKTNYMVGKHVVGDSTCNAHVLAGIPLKSDIWQKRLLTINHVIEVIHKY